MRETPQKTEAKTMKKRWKLTKEQKLIAIELRKFLREQIPKIEGATGIQADRIRLHIYDISPQLQQNFQTRVIKKGIVKVKRPKKAPSLFFKFPFRKLEISVSNRGRLNDKAIFLRNTLGNYDTLHGRIFIFNPPLYPCEHTFESTIETINHEMLHYILHKTIGFLASIQYENVFLFVEGTPIVEVDPEGAPEIVYRLKEKIKKRRSKILTCGDCKWKVTAKNIKLL
jgi:hypothetical protein